jgi:hypothetical protein
MIRPAQSLVRREWKNDLWLQSCWIMNSRTRNPAAGTASTRATGQYPALTASHIRTQINAKGSAVIRISAMLRARRGLQYAQSVCLRDLGAVVDLGVDAGGVLMVLLPRIRGLKHRVYIKACIATITLRYRTF